MTAKEWLQTMEKASDYNPLLTPLIEKYGEMLLQENGLQNDAEDKALLENCEHYQHDHCDCLTKCCEGLLKT